MLFSCTVRRLADVLALGVASDCQAMFSSNCHNNVLLFSMIPHTRRGRGQHKHIWNAQHLLRFLLQGPVRIAGPLLCRCLCGHVQAMTWLS